MTLLQRPLHLFSALLLCLACLICVDQSQAAVKKVRKAPQGFIGANFNPWEIAEAGGDPVQELERAAASGVESIRFPLYWMRIQRYNVTYDQLGDSSKPYYTPDPEGGVAYRWYELDRLMLAAGRLGISVLPTVMGAPSWADDPAYSTPGTPQFVNMGVPADYTRFARFALAANQRYRSSSSFWTERATKPAPIVGWQIWNEPDHPNFWPAHPGEKNGPRGTKLGWAPSYLQLFNTVRNAIRKDDPTARIMLASLLSVPQTSLALYYAAGGQNLFDQTATNMFTTPENTLKRIGVFRSYLSSKRSRAPIYLTEFSFLSGKGMWPSKVSLMVDTITDTPVNAGKRAAAALRYFVANRTKYNLAGVYWYCWASDDDLQTSGIWSFAGLRKLTPGGILNKPGLSFFAATALELEGR